MALSDINIRVGANIQELQKKMGKAERRLNRFSKKMKKSGENMSKNITLPIAAAGGAALKFAADYEEAMVEVQKVSDETTADKLSGSIREMSETIPMAQEKLAGLAADAARFGIEGSKRIEQFTRTTAKMAEATDLTANRAGEALAKISNMANVPVENVENLGSAINELSNNFSTSSSEIVESMMRSSAAASNFGMSGTQIAGISAQMNAMSESAERAGTRVRGLFQALQDPGKVKKMANAIGMTADEFEAVRQNSPQKALMLLVNAFEKNGDKADRLREVMRRTSRTALAALSKNTDDLTEALGMSEQAFEDNTSLQREFEAASKTFNKKLQTTINKLKDVAITIGNQIMPAVKDMMKGIKSAADWFSGLNDSTKNTIVKVVGLVAAIGPLKFALGAVAGQISGLIKGSRKTMGVFKKLISRFGAAKVAAGGFGLAIAGLVAKIIHHNQKVENFRTAQKEIKAAVTQAKESIAEEKVEVDQLVEKIKDENTSRREKKKVLDELKGVSRKHFGDLRVEKGLLDDLKERQKDYNESLMQSAKIKAFEDRLVSLYKELDKLKGKKPEITLIDKLEGEFKGLFQMYDRNKKTLESGIKVAAPKTSGLNAQKEAMNEHQKKIENVKNAIDKLGGKLLGLKEDTDNGNKSIKDASGAYEKLSQKLANTEQKIKNFLAAGKTVPPELLKKAQKLREELQNVNKQAAQLASQGGKGGSQTFSQNVVQNVEGEGMPSIEGPQTEGMEQIDSKPPGLAGIGKLIDGWDKLSKKQQQSVKQQIAAENNLTQNVIQGAIKQAKMKEKQAARMQQAMERTSNRVVGAVTRMSQQGEKSFADYAKAAANSARKTIAAEIASGVAAYVSSALKNVPFPFGIIAAGAAAAGASALFNSVVPSFAQGGAVSGPQQVIAGDNPSGKEAMIPFERMGEFLGMMGGNDNNEPRELYSHITNRGIYMSNQRGTNKNKRMT